MKEASPSVYLKKMFGKNLPECHNCGSHTMERTGVSCVKEYRIRDEHLHFVEFGFLGKSGFFQ